MADYQKYREDQQKSTLEVKKENLPMLKKTIPSCLNWKQSSVYKLEMKVTSDFLSASCCQGQGVGAVSEALRSTSEGGITPEFLQGKGPGTRGQHERTAEVRCQDAGDVWQHPVDGTL